VSTTTAFVLFFKLIPYRPVPLLHAMAGGLVAGLLFEVAKKAFALYVTGFPGQQTIYGAFATVPIFLLWIYLSWVIVLLGAEITQCLTIYKAVSSRKRSSLYSNPIYAAFRVLLRLYEAQEAGRPLADKQLFASEPDLGFEALNDALERLDEANWISRNDAFEWVLIRDLHRETLVDLMQVTPIIVPSKDVPYLKLDGADERFVENLRMHAAWLDENMVGSIADLIIVDATEPIQARPVARVGGDG
jgi:membrane protein